jgi:hypothetical protein
MYPIALRGELHFVVMHRSSTFTSSINLPGAERVRTLPAHEFCKQGFVLGKASEAGFGNEMYKILTAGALSCHVKPIFDHRANKAYAFTLSYFSSLSLI